MRTIFEYTLNNYFKWGFQDGIEFSGMPENPDQIKLWIDVGQNSPGLAIGPYRDEACRAAKLIEERADKPITLFLSGGIDSEVMMLAFMDAGVPFDCTTIALDYGLNRHEVEIAVQLCERWKIDHHLVRIDPFSIWYNPPAWMMKYRLESGILYVMLEAISRRRDRFQVLGITPRLHADPWRPTEMFVEVRKSMVFHTMAWIDLGHPSVSFFHMYTPELLFHWLNDPLIRAWENQFTASEIPNFNSIKPLFYWPQYKEIGFSRKKWTGEENIRNHIQDLYDNQWRSFRKFNPMLRRPLEDLRTELG